MKAQKETKQDDVISFLYFIQLTYSIQDVKIGHNVSFWYIICMKNYCIEINITLLILRGLKK